MSAPNSCNGKNDCCKRLKRHVKCLEKQMQLQVEAITQLQDQVELLAGLLNQLQNFGQEQVNEYHEKLAELQQQIKSQGQGQGTTKRFNFGDLSSFSASFDSSLSDLSDNTTE